ncbi:DNA-binding protein [Mycolicibacterium novocastrense]|uniref:Zn-ribbon domain-containing OB-fold protein n=1 Tax=Mycolicibacterium novocastrense TaxID=59813 RepID=UPI000746A71D|nr:OB-fold domain-containing protein [Mycolicibacterium novocastrense]KUH64594.1 DNA-binding protein [Mycolicibacterium novocastrense]KUH64709.1 DNA-binding protein [Mycolicibacterium novocastrense]KUH76871.1 DNA-binding protein [Mycolicibacterium novocastrense]
MSEGFPVPQPSAVSAPFWAATEKHRLVMQRCEACRRLTWYPRHVCPHCGGLALQWEQLSGQGVVHAVSVHHRAAHPAFADRVPYSVVLVDLAEGARIMSNVFGPSPAVGDEVFVAWLPLDDGRNLPTFEPR